MGGARSRCCKKLHDVSFARDAKLITPRLDLACVIDKRRDLIPEKCAAVHQVVTKISEHSQRFGVAQQAIHRAIGVASPWVGHVNPRYLIGSGSALLAPSLSRRSIGK